METHCQRIGGEETVRRVVDRFYDLMDEDPDYYGIRKLHAKDLMAAFWKTADYMRNREG